MKVSLIPSFLLATVVILLFTGCATHEANRAPKPQPLPPPTALKPTPLPPPAAARRSAPSTPPVAARKTAPKSKPTPAREIVVTEAPPKPIAETLTKEPAKGYVWIPGSWIWRGHWVWSPGHWVVPPSATSVWNAPRYSYRNGKHYWIRGTWRG